MSGTPPPSLPPALLQTRPEEDAGSDTGGYYEFQYGWVAAMALDMTDGRSGLQWILCEWHTDFVLGWANDFAPVSVKHRESSSGRWTLAKLFSDGGLLTLYRRWDALGRPSECRWITNGGFDSDAATLAKACAQGDSAYLKAWVQTHGWRFDGVSAADVNAFLHCLRLAFDGTRTADQRIVNIEKCCRPALLRHGHSVARAGDAYDAVVGLARVASHGFTDVQPTAWTAASQGALDDSVLLAAEADRRLIRCDHVRSKLRDIAGPASADPPPAAPRTTTLVRKLRRGRVVPTAEWSARRSRMSWTAFEAQYAEPLPDGGRQSNFDALRAHVLDAATEAQLEAQASATPYGNQMLALLMASMRSMAADSPPVAGVTTNLLMGLVYDLTAQCEVWWSPRFELDDAEDEDVEEDAP